MTGWLVSQLPEAMQRQALLAAFAQMGEEVGDSIRFQLLGLDQQLDPETTTDGMLGYLASWFGFTFDTTTDAELIRRLLKQVGPIIRTRGTSASLAALLEVLSDGEVTIQDPGCVIGSGLPRPPASNVVVARVAQAGPLGAERLTAIAQRELPVGVELKLVVGGAS
ncbi:MAG: hypothetical protein KIT69_02420 [Propionibacteriaceae bacterium]|nr:hypothetical protein [Propionibacteriaceae bacterium]